MATLPLTPNLKANQIVTSMLIVSGATGTSSRLIILDSAATLDTSGAINQPAFNTTSIGLDTFIFISGSVGTRNQSPAGPGIVAFGGDTVNSGTIFADAGLVSKGRVQLSSSTTAPALAVTGSAVFGVTAPILPSGVKFFVSSSFGSATTGSIDGLALISGDMYISGALVIASGVVYPTTAAAAAARTALGITTGWPISIFGSGQNGTADLNGINTVTWASLSSTTYTMTANAFCADLTVRNGITLAKRYVLFVTGTLTIEATGLIHDNGNNSTGSVAGTTVGPTGRLPESAGFAGGTGRTTTGIGSNGGGSNPGVGAAGGAGGQAGGNSGGVAGVITTPDVSSGGIGDPVYGDVWLLRSTTNWIRINGGTGGGAGGASTATGTATSGGGGGGAPVSIIKAKTIAGTGTIRCNGGSGSHAVSTGDGSAGGGGGGGGGYLWIYTNSVPTCNIEAAGGAAGNGSGPSGSNGIAGTSGTIRMMYPS